MAENTCGECGRYVDWLPEEPSMYVIQKACIFHSIENLGPGTRACDDFRPREENTEESRDD